MQPATQAWGFAAVRLLGTAVIGFGAGWLFGNPFGGLAAAIADAKLPWHVTRLGCRAEYLFGAKEPKNGTEAHDAMDFELERFMHLYAMNRGILLTPFHNMALMSPQTDASDVDHHTLVFREAVAELADSPGT